MRLSLEESFHSKPETCLQFLPLHEWIYVPLLEKVFIEIGLTSYKAKKKELKLASRKLCSQMTYTYRDVSKNGNRNAMAKITDLYPIFLQAL